MTPPPDPPSAEHGDRAAFLARIRARQGPPPTVGPHPPPPRPAAIPEVRYRSLDGDAAGAPPEDALERVFVEAARAVAATVHLGGLDEAIAVVVATHEVRTAVLSAEPLAQATRPLLEALGVAVTDHAGPADQADPVALAADLELGRPTGGGDARRLAAARAAAADLGVTSCVAAIAATGSVVVDSDRAGGRAAGLLPTVHLCVVPRDLLVATPSDVFRRGPRPLPSNRVVVTGPSRTGDIEQIITLGAHGPTAVHLVVV